jgi:hypothetical protein
LVSYVASMMSDTFFFVCCVMGTRVHEMNSAKRVGCYDVLRHERGVFKPLTVISLRPTKGQSDSNVYLQVGRVIFLQNCTTTLLNVYLFFSVISIFVDSRLPPFCIEFFVSVNFKQYLTSDDFL